MKLDGVTMENTEPTEATAGAEPISSQDNVTEQVQVQPQEAANCAATVAASKANGKTVAGNLKVKPKAGETKAQPTAKSVGAFGSSQRPGTTSHRTANDFKSHNNASAAAVKKTMTAAKASSAGAVPKRPVTGPAASATAKTQTRVPDKRSAGPARTTSVAAATVTNGTKLTTANDSVKKRPAAETVNGARPKTTASASRPVVSTAPKPSTSTTTKAVGAAAASKTTRSATVPLTSRPAPTKSRPTTATTKTTTVPTKPSASTLAKTAASRLTTAPSAGRTTAAQPLKATTAKKDVNRPASAPVAKKPTASVATKKPEPPKPMAAVKLNAVSKMSATTKAADTKMSQSKPTPTKKPVADKQFAPINKLPLGRPQPASPANRFANNGISKTKGGAKPTQTVPPFTSSKKTEVANTTPPAVETQSAAAAVAVAGTTAEGATAVTVMAETQAEATVTLPQGSTLAEPAPENIPTPVLAQDTTPELAQPPQEATQYHEAASPPPQSPDRTTIPKPSPPMEQTEISTPLLTMQEPIPAPAQPALPPVASPPDVSEETVYLLTDQTPSKSTALPVAANAIQQIVPPMNLNEEEDEEEREGSQLVSVSEMSGTTQPTEESRPGSAGPIGGSAWRAGGALLSELDSEEVSGSQQGASELSAPGVLEGTESMDDLGDGSLKGAIDMEGASAGSPDFEKVPDIPVNDFDDDEDDSDRVCDMDVGSERTDEPQRPRHDNDVDDEEEDDDVEMASEGVTESGLESYGNADEDDFAEDERLDNLNRVAQPPPPPPLLPSAPAAQWDQPNPFADPWAEPLEPVQVAGAAAASSLADPWQADSKTPTQAPAQAWLELGSAPFAPEIQEDPHHSFVKGEAQNLGTQMYINQSSPAPSQTMTPAPLSAPGMSLSSTLSSETSTPEELDDCNREGKFQLQDVPAPTLSPQHNYQDMGIHSEKGIKEEEEEEAEPETLPADEILGGPATAPTSNPSSSSVTEDEASDTEGEAQLEDSLESPRVENITFEVQPPAQRGLSTVEEGEEVEIEEVVSGAAEDTTPPSATSLASYGFDTMTTASNSNAQSTGESCIKSPGIFSLEELPEEAKEPCLIPQTQTQPCLAEQQYIECGKQDVESAEHLREDASGSEEAPEPLSAVNTLQQPEENPDDIQPPYYSAICEKSEDSFAGFTALPHSHRRDHAAYPRTYYDIVKPHSASPPKLTCADLPPRSPGQQALSPQLRRLEQHQRQLLELQQRMAQQSRPLEEAEQERKRREEEEQRKKKEEAEEEIKRNKEERKMKEQALVEKEDWLRKEEELKQRRDLELQLQQQQQELKQRQQIMQWQQELQQSNKGQTVLLSPSSGLCTIYEALENSDEEDAEGKKEELDVLEHTKEKKELKHNKSYQPEVDNSCEKMTTDEDQHQDSSLSDSPPPPDSLQSSSNPSQDGDCSSPCPPESPERPPPLDLDWGKKVDIVQQLINQTLLLNGDGCSSLLLLPGGAGGTLSPLESSLWPSLLPPLTPPSATVTSVSSFSPEATGSSPQGEWTVVELETHH